MTNRRVSKGLQAGDVVRGRYEIVGFLGEGGFGAAYRAVDRERFNASCVVKQLHVSRARSDVAVRLFEREARILEELRHERIPKLQAYFELRSRYYLVHDYIEGETLADRLARVSRLEEREVSGIVLQVLDILEYLHGRPTPIIHRDIKPSNLIAGADGQMYLIDFGAVKEAIDGGADGKPGTTVGTGGYAPSEQSRGHPVPASDLYALGATALHLLSGTPPRDWFEDGKPVWQDRVRASASFMAFLSGTLADLPSRLKFAAEARAVLAGSVVGDARGSRQASAVGASPARPAPADGPTVISEPVAKSSGAVTARAQAPGGLEPPRRGLISSRMIGAGGLAVGAAALATAAILKSTDAKGSTPQTDSSNVAGVSSRGELCADSTVRTFRTESQFDLHVYCPKGWTSLWSAEQQATRIMSPDNRTQVWASVRTPVSGSETLAEFAERWQSDMEIALGALRLEADPTAATDSLLVRYRVVAQRFADLAPGSLQIERVQSGSNRFFAWSLFIATGPASRDDVRRVLSSIEYRAPDAGPPRAGSTQ